MKRRDFITLLGASAAAWPLAARAQQPSMPVVGILYATSAADWADRMADVRRGLAETGFVVGRNVAIEERWADGQPERMPWMAADLIGRRAAVILTGGNTSAVRAMVAAMPTVPIVFTTGADPIEAGLVASLSRPGGNATGVTLVSGELGPKKLELLHEIVPSIKKIAMLVNQNNPATSDPDIRSAQAAAPRLGVEVIVVNGGTESELDLAFATSVQRGAGALLVGSDAFFILKRETIAALALHHRLPMASSGRGNARAGHLITYGAIDNEMYRQAGIYLGRILKGEKPADLPVVQPTRFELIVNLKTAKAIGLTIPETFLVRADEVIE
jgi:putative ABC transport system substrate-binding protein